MEIAVNDLDYRKVLPLLKRNGFGIVEGVNPYAPDEVLQARIWAKVDDAGIPGGGEVGSLTRQLGVSIVRYTLTLNDFYLKRSRIHGLLTDILNEFVRGDK